jgi:ribosomal protein S18 acetylase RimI-like enzyme
MSDHPNLVARPVAELTADVCAAAMERCFEGYVVPVRVTAEGWERRFRAEHLDPFASRVYFAGDEAAAALFITRRGWTSRVGAMAVATGLRGTGLGRRVMQSAIDDARARGDHALLLEVIEQNTPAVNLYTSLGFRSMRRLVGWRWAPSGGEIEADAGDALREIDPLELSQVVQREGDAGLPWQLAPETLAAATAPAVAYSLDDHAYALVSNPQAETLSLASLVVTRAERRSGWGTRMLRALARAFPGKPWQAVAIVPEATAPEFFLRAGWERSPIRQFDMRLDLRAGEPRA